MHTQRALVTCQKVDQRKDRKETRLEDQTRLAVEIRTRDATEESRKFSKQGCTYFVCITTDKILKFGKNNYS